MIVERVDSYTGYAWLSRRQISEEFTSHKQFVMPLNRLKCSLCFLTAEKARKQVDERMVQNKALEGGREVNKTHLRPKTADFMYGHGFSKNSGQSNILGKLIFMGGPASVKQRNISTSIVELRLLDLRKDFALKMTKTHLLAHNHQRRASLRP